MTTAQWINGNLAPVPAGPGDPAKTVARRFPARQGYATRLDVPTRSECAAKALALYMEGEIGAYSLNWMCQVQGAPRERTIRARALQVAGELMVRNWLVRIETCQRCEAGAEGWR